MTPENLTALAKIIKLTKRFDMGVIVGRWDPEADETFVKVVTPKARDFWESETLVGDYCAWANVISEHDPIDDEDHAATWLGLTMTQFDQLSYTADEEAMPCLWTRYAKLFDLDVIHFSTSNRRVASEQITPQMAARMLEAIVAGDVIFV